MTMIDNSLQLFVIHLALMEAPAFGPIHVLVELDGLVMLVKLVSDYMSSTNIINIVRKI